MIIDTKKDFKEGDLFCVDSETGDRSFKKDTMIVVTVEVLWGGARVIWCSKLIKDPYDKTLTIPNKGPDKIHYNSSFISLVEDEWYFFEYEGDFKLVK